MKEVLYFVMGYLVASILAIAMIKFKASFGTIRMVKNPNNDPDNPYILQFGADPRKWLDKSYVILEVKRK